MSTRLPLWLLNSSFCFFITRGKADITAWQAQPSRIPVGVLALNYAGKQSWAVEIGALYKQQWTGVEALFSFRACGNSWSSSLLLIASFAAAQENGTAYEALRVVGNQFGRGAVNHVISVTGVEG